MGLNKVKPNGNMYEFVSHTWNAIKGKCPHSCSYCYMKRWGEQPKLRFDEKELKTDLGSDNFIFVGSSCDMFADNIPEDWVAKTINYCNKFDNRYLFQSKNPKGFLSLAFPKNTTLCITLETDKYYPKIMGNSPEPQERAWYFAGLPYDKMITVEPIMKFDLLQFSEMILRCNPIQVNIGADSGNNNLPEPTKEEIETLIYELQGWTKVHIKKTLGRLMK